MRIVEIPDLPLKGDVSDFIQRGGTLDQLNALYARAHDWTPEWEFATSVPEENEKYVRTLEREIEDAGGLNGFWNLAAFTGLPTPFGKLNRILGGGLQKGRSIRDPVPTWVRGKLLLALQFALAVRFAAGRHGVLIFSMEMGWRAVSQRMAGIEAKVDLARRLPRSSARQARQP